MYVDVLVQDTYAATLAAKVFRTMMALTVAFDLETTQFDVQNAFPHANLDERIYCECPHGFKMAGKCLAVHYPILLKAEREPLYLRRSSWSRHKSPWRVKMDSGSSHP